MSTTDGREQAMAPLTEVRDKLSEIIEKVSTTGADLIITKRGKPAAVVIGYDEYEALIETLNILSDDHTMAAITEAEAQATAGELVDLD